MTRRAVKEPIERKFRNWNSR